MRPPDTQLTGETLPVILAVALTCVGSVCAFAATALHLQTEPTPTAPIEAGVAAAPTTRADAPASTSARSEPVSPASPVTIASTAGPRSASPRGKGFDANPSASASAASRRAAPASAESVASASAASAAPSSRAAVKAPPSAAPDPAVPCRLAVIQFRLGVKVPDPKARAPLPGALAWLRADARRRVLLRGHADAQGTDYFNMRLSASRARWIRQWFIGKGAEPARVTAQAFGEFLPAVDALPADARQRRVEIFGFGGPCPSSGKTR